MTASLKESVHPPAADVRVDRETNPYAKRDEEFVRILNAAGLACELDMPQLEAIAAGVEEDRVDSRRMDILERYYGVDDSSDAAERRRAADRFFHHHDAFVVTAHQIVAKLAVLNRELSDVTLQRIGTDEGPLVLKAGEHFSAVTDEEDDSAEEGTVAVRALVRALNALLAKASIDERLVPLVPDELRELYVGVTEEGAMTLLQGGCTEISAVQALREFASW
ncbi:MAG: hypothetical protein AAF500_15930 [Myxococcota bacterium]